MASPKWTRRTFRAREAVAMGEKILVRREGVVGQLVINNPERHNAVSEEMWEAIAAGWRRWRRTIWCG